MSKRDPRIDAYIRKSADFARPIIERFRAVVHEACPEAEETLKWSSPTFMYHGRILCGIAAFKEHCRVVFWKGELLAGANGESANVTVSRVTKLSELPPKKQLASYIRQSRTLIDDGITARRPRAKRAQEVDVPDYFMTALKKNRKALKTFEAFSPSHRREYVEWITEAKRDETRARRIATALEWLAEGKPRNWKYIPD